MRALAAGLILAALGAACDNVTDGGTGALPDALIGVGDNWFSPATDTIPVGGVVLWAWQGQTGHNVIFDGTPGAPDNCDVQAAGWCERVFETAGQFDYGCTLHSNMFGSITVTP